MTSDDKFYLGLILLIVGLAAGAILFLVAIGWMLSAIEPDIMRYCIEVQTP